MIGEIEPEATGPERAAIAAALASEEGLRPANAWADALLPQREDQLDVEPLPLRQPAAP